MSWSADNRHVLKLVLAVVVASVVAISGRGPTRFDALGSGRAELGGSRILYSGDWTGQSEIFAVDPSGRAPLGELTFGREPVPERGCESVACGFVAPIPSRDGRWVLYRGIGGQAAWQPGVVQQGAPLWLAHADGSSPRVISPGAGVQVAWATDSSRFAYSTSDGLHVVRMRGLRNQLVYRGSCGGCGLAWSPDGRTLAFFDTSGQLVLLRHGRGVPIVSVNDTGVLLLAWSPDGKWIAAGQSSIDPVVYPHTYDPYTVHPQVTVIAPDGSMVTKITGASAPVWSPDGRLLAYQGADGIRLWSPVTERSRLLTGDHGFDLGWSPDGRSLAYVQGSIIGNEYSEGFEESGDIRTVTLFGRVRTVVAAAAPYGGQITSLAWARTTARGVYQRPVVPDGVFAGGPVSFVAGDGGRAALVACHHVYVWTLSQTTMVRADPDPSPLKTLTYPAGTCPSQGRREQIYSLALAGDRVAWGEKTAGLGFDWLFRVTTLAATPQTVDLKLPNQSEGCLGCEYNTVVGSGSLLAFNDFPTCVEPSCGSTSIFRADPGGCPCPAIRTDPGPLYLDDADTGRIVAHGRNAIVVLDRTGTQLLSIPVPVPVPTSLPPRLRARLTGNDLVVALDNQLLDYDATTGTLLHTWPLPNALFFQFQDAAHGLAAYILDDTVRLVRLADGQTATVANGTAASFTDTGLVYADGTRIHLVPYDRLPIG